MLSTFFTDPVGTVVVVLGLVVIGLIVVVISLQARMRKFLIGVDSANIKDSIEFVSAGLKDMQTFKAEMEIYLAEVESRLQKSVRAVHTVRFNPFKGTGDGGNQSFATAFLTENGDGVILSSLYSRDRVSVFSKPVIAHVSEFELSEEEAEALESAKAKLKSSSKK